MQLIQDIPPDGIVMYMSREKGSQANTHQKTTQKQEPTHGQGGTVVVGSTVWPFHFAADGHQRIQVRHGLGAFYACLVSSLCGGV